MVSLNVDEKPDRVYLVGDVYLSKSPVEDDLSHHVGRKRTLCVVVSDRHTETTRAYVTILWVLTGTTERMWIHHLTDYYIHIGSLLKTTE